MKTTKKISFCVLIVAMCLLLGVGYAAIADTLAITGRAGVSPTNPYDIYIANVTPDSSSGVTINNTSGTVLFTSVNGSGTATFTVNVVNVSSKTYIFDRVIDGIETNLEGVYSETDITYELHGISRLDEIAPRHGRLSFDITITVPKGVSTNNYILKFNFIEKTNTEILPGSDEFNVTLQYNNGTPDKTLLLHTNDFIPIPDTPLREGYTFTGWYTDTTYTSAWNFEIDQVTNHMTLYAGWNKNAPEYIVTFNPNNGSPRYTVVITSGDLIPPQTSPTLEGYTFIGWYEDQNYTTPWNFDTDRVYSNTTLYGGWEIYTPPVPPDCNITFKPNNGDPDTTIVVLTGEFIPRPTTPIKDGYSFTGWYTDEACTVAWNFEVNKVKDHTTLYAGWEKIVQYTITFKPNNGTVGNTITVDRGSLIPRPTPPTKDGYMFIGWYTDADCTAGWNFDTDVPTSNMTLYGGWQKTSAPSQGDEFHGDFKGLVEALLSDDTDCLNDNDLIFDAVLESLTSKKRPAEDAPILHCSVNSISGGTMSSIATHVNSKLTSNLHFIFEVDPDPAYQNKRMRLYMYYEEDLKKANSGDQIVVYQQIVSRGSDGVWYADGTYIGVATVGYYFGGGNSGKDVKTISPYTWKSNVTVAE